MGHCALDIQPDGSFLPGGTVLYSALTAARMGLRVGILTAGEPESVATALAPFDGLFAIHIVPTAATTTFENLPTPAGRKQTLHAWAGPIHPDELPVAWRRAAILHLGPIADELPPDAWAEALGANREGAWTIATPQGWLRHWNTLPSPVRHDALALPHRLLDRLSAMVISVEERDVAETAVRRVARHGLGAITYGPRGVEILQGEMTTRIPTFPVAVRDETGAGDVFAAAWAVGLARGERPEVAARGACACASLSVTAPGPHGIPTATEVAALLAANSDRTA